MFGFVMADGKELSHEQNQRYGAVYCGICRRIREQSGQLARLSLRYDMAFLALLLMSLYEPEETQGDRACLLHPVKPRPWVDNAYIRYAADMNVALAYYNTLDDWQDDRKLASGVFSAMLKKEVSRIAEAWPRQWQAMGNCMEKLRQLEQEGCENPDIPAGCFGELMGELFVYTQDMWAPALHQMGQALGRFIYLADAAVDYRKDLHRKQYNPFISMETGFDPARWEQYLTMAMGRCARYYESLPLVQDKGILDNIVYSGVWVSYASKRGKQNGGDENARSV